MERADVKPGGIIQSEGLRQELEANLGNHDPSSHFVDGAKYNRGRHRKGKVWEKKRQTIMLKLETVLDKAFRHQLRWKNVKKQHLNGRQEEQD